MFRDVETAAQLTSAKRIVNEYPVYGETDNYLGDLEAKVAGRGVADHGHQP